MNVQKLLYELTLTGFRVLIYCLYNDEWNMLGYGRWYGLEYKKAQNDWKRGIGDLLEKGYMVKDKDAYKWTKYARESIKKGKTEENY